VEPADAVLVVDDDDDIRLTLVQILREEGFRACEARNGLEALERILEEEPDLVLLDLLMPVLDGWQVLETLRNARPNLPVVVLSAVPVDDEVVDYIPKPVSLERLEQILDAVRSRIAERKTGTG
jgi:CheY-like chemotaxis protein